MSDAEFNAAGTGDVSLVTRPGFSFGSPAGPFHVKAQIPNRERGSGGDRNSLGVEANGQGSSNR